MTIDRETIGRWLGLAILWGMMILAAATLAAVITGDWLFTPGSRAIFVLAMFYIRWELLYGRKERR